MRTIRLWIFIMAISSSPLFAQNLEGEITYEKVMRWTAIYSRLTFLSNEEKGRIEQTWGKDDESKTKMVLYFNEKQSCYTYPKVIENEHGWSWSERDYKIYRNFEKETKTDVIGMLGKTYIVEDSLRIPTWKVMNKIKEIAGHMCMMAVTEDTVKGQKIAAWFANDLPVSGGPELYAGLPGMILELDVNDGDMVVTAIDIKMKPVAAEDINVPKKLKGRKINDKQYATLVSDHIQDSVKARRAPFWAMPY
ncbi:MAG: GLPGLI family protein [Dyadobacter sp. 50-39]|uniref:GLPGLI family protein n=1 Tax=Dyadobacter sp. 50-39 TaxID=1895756 RepID=UPI00095962C7|nr:GLPGLI family protein [Dyadobacter sp. 50-39]OJV19950.1 MAG: GLPGLI family protein [Dyadobacter sp. 50-39]